MTVEPDCVSTVDNVTIQAESSCVCCQCRYPTTAVPLDLDPLQRLLRGFCVACLRDVVQEAEVSARNDAHLYETLGEHPPDSWDQFSQNIIDSTAPDVSDIGLQDDDDSKSHTKVSNQRAYESYLEALERNQDEEALDAIASREQEQIFVTKRAIACTSRELQQLSTYHLMNSTFFIWVADDCGTINGCRLGRLPSLAIPTVEVNSALGDVAFLISCLMKETNAILKATKKENYISKVGRILVKGRQSMFLSLSDDSSLYPLFMTESRLGSYFHLPKMNEGLGGLTLLFSEMVQALQTLNTQGIREPFLVHQHTVSGHSVKYRTGEEASWTAAWRLFLIDLKWLVGYLSQLRLTQS